MPFEKENKSTVAYCANVNVKTKELGANFN